MKVKARVTGNDLTEGIRFYGDTHYDYKAVEQIKQLAMVLEDVVYNLESLNREVEDRQEAYAKELKWQLETMRNDLLWIAFGKEIAEDIIKLLEVAE